MGLAFLIVSVVWGALLWRAFKDYTPPEPE